MGGKYNRILIIGLGQIGYSNAEYMSSLGLEVDGFDINDRAVKRALDEGVISGEASDFRDYDYYIVCVSTHDPDEMFRPYMNGLYEVVDRIGLEGKEDALVSIESTVAYGTSANLIEMLGHRLHVAHFPHRFFGQEKEEHGVNQMRVLGGCEPCCAEAAERFYNGLLGIPTHLVDSIGYAELSKVIENSHRFLQIAFAEELKIFCDDYGLDYEELRAAVNTKWNVDLLEARQGIGGHCLPKDSQMYLDLTETVLSGSLLATAKQIDVSYRRHINLNSESLKVRSASEIRRELGIMSPSKGPSASTTHISPASDRQ